MNTVLLGQSPVLLAGTHCQEANQAIGCAMTTINHYKLSIKALYSVWLLPPKTPKWS